MQDLAWPFLVSRNRVLGYRTIVAPGFLLEVDTCDFLAEKVEPGSAAGAGVFATQLPDTPAGPLTLVYRARAAESRGERLRDSAGRRVTRFAGVVLRGLRSAGEVGDATLTRAEAELEPHFQAFWESRERQRAWPSKGLDAASGETPDAPATPVPPERPEDVPSPPRRWFENPRVCLLSVAFAAFTLGMIIGGLLMHQIGVPAAQPESPKLESKAEPQPGAAPKAEASQAASKP